MGDALSVKPNSEWLVVNRVSDCRVHNFRVTRRSRLLNFLSLCAKVFNYPLFDLDFQLRLLTSIHIDYLSQKYGIMLRFGIIFERLLFAC